MYHEHSPIESNAHLTAVPALSILALQGENKAYLSGKAVPLPDAVTNFRVPHIWLFGTEKTHLHAAIPLLLCLGGPETCDQTEQDELLWRAK